MAVELAQIAAGLPMAASFAVAGGISSLREGRRRASLNEAVHELRRPLQVLALSLPADSGEGGACGSSLRLAAAALERLDREINGGPAEASVGRVEIAALLEAAIDRWRAAARCAGRGVRLRWLAGDPVVAGDGLRLAQALDNLISNALQHGGGKVTVEVRERGNRLLLSVRDRGGADAAPRGRKRPGASHRHGHGLRIVARTAREHGGRFALRRSESGTEARLELPLDPGPGAR